MPSHEIVCEFRRITLDTSWEMKHVTTAPLLQLNSVSIIKINSY